MRSGSKGMAGGFIDMPSGYYCAGFLLVCNHNLIYPTVDNSAARLMNGHLYLKVKNSHFVQVFAKLEGLGIATDRVRS